jgi:gas vesicle protein
MTNERTYYSHDAEMRAMGEKTKLAVLTLALGLGIGAVLAILFAPSSGQKTRDELASSVEDTVNTGRDAVAPIVKRVGEEISELRKTVEERVTHLK